MKNDELLCPHCAGGPLYIKKGVPSGAGFGPNLLPGLGAPFDLVACENCGFVQFFVNRFHRKKMAKVWKRLAPESTRR